MRRYPPAALGLIATTVLAATVTTWYSMARYGLHPDHFTIFVVLAAGAAVSLLYPVPSPGGHNAFYSLSTAFLFSAVLLLPLSWTTLLCLTFWIPSLPRRLKKWRPVEAVVPPLTNGAQVAVITAVCHGLISLTGARDASSWSDVAWLAVAATVFVTTQTLHVSFLIAFNKRVPWRSVDVMHLDSFLSDLLLPLLGMVIAIMWRVHPALLLVGAIGLALVYHMMQKIQLVRQAELDPKTGIYNFRYFEEQLKTEVSRAVSLRRPVSLIFADLDYLRNINNTFGHQAGDAAIMHIASIFQSLGSKSGVPARFGGEEFVLLLPGTDGHEAWYLAERLREAVERARISLDNGVLSCTMSFGVATCPDDGTTPEALVKAADAAVYAAKSGGRNRVCVANSSAQATLNQVLNQVSAASMEASPKSAHREATPYRHDRLSDSSSPAAASEAGAQRPRLPLAVQLLIGPALLATTSVLAWSVAELQAGTNWIALCALALLAGITQFYRVDIFIQSTASRSSVSMTMAIALATAAYLGLAEAVVVNLVAAAVHGFDGQKRELHKTLLNITMAVCSAAAGALPFEWLHRQGLSGSVLGYLATFTGAMLFYLTNIGLLTLIVAWSNARSPWQVWRQSWAWLTPHYFSLTIAGGFVGYFHPVLGWIGTLTLVGLLLLLRRSFQQQVVQMESSLRNLQEARDILSRAHRLERKSLQELTEAVSAIIDARDASVYGHSRQVARYAVAIAEELGITEQVVIDDIRSASLLHDLGKVGVPEAILHKPARLSPAEYEIVKGHAALGERILNEVGSLKRVAAIVGHHHECWDGTGYPRSIAGEAIPLGARIVAVADALDCMLTDRPYSQARPLSAALTELDRCSGSQFDPAVVAAVQRLTKRWPEHYFQNDLAGSGPYGVLDGACAVGTGGGN